MSDFFFISYGFFLAISQNIIEHIVVGASYRSKRHFTLALHHVELISTTFRSPFLLVQPSSSLLLLLVHLSIDPEQDHNCANVFPSDISLIFRLILFFVFFAFIFASIVV